MKRWTILFFSLICCLCHRYSWSLKAKSRYSQYNVHPTEAWADWLMKMMGMMNDDLSIVFWVFFFSSEFFSVFLTPALAGKVTVFWNKWSLFVGRALPLWTDHTSSLLMLAHLYSFLPGLMYKDSIIDSSQPLGYYANRNPLAPLYPLGNLSN